MCIVVLSVPAWGCQIPWSCSYSCELLCGCWKLNSDPVEEQPMLLTPESSLQPNLGFFCGTLLPHYRILKEYPLLSLGGLKHYLRPYCATGLNKPFVWKSLCLCTSFDPQWCIAEHLLTWNNIVCRITCLFLSWQNFSVACCLNFSSASAFMHTCTVLSTKRV